MLEIIHDIAPSANLYFYGLPENSGVNNLTQAVNDLKNYCDIIVDDISCFDESFFSDNTSLGQSIGNFIANDGVYVTSCGNYRLKMLSGTTNFSSLGYHYFDDGNEYITIVSTDDEADLFLQWKEDWNNPFNDINLEVYNDQNQLLPGGDITQGSFPPMEAVHCGSGTFKIKIKRVFTDGYPIEFKLLGSKVEITNNHTNQIFGHAAFPKIISVAAYEADDQTATSYYSSVGPATMYSYTDQQWTVQQVPTITATSGVHTYVGDNNLWPGGNPVFSGTSASAPHIAGLTALYFSKLNGIDNLNKTNLDFIEDLKHGASSIDGEPAGIWHARSGWGKANILNTININFLPQAVVSPASGIYPSGEYINILSWLNGWQCYYTYTTDNTEPLAPEQQPNNVHFVDHYPWRIPTTGHLHYDIKVQLYNTTTQDFGPVVYRSYDLQPSVRIAQEYGYQSFGNWKKWENNQWIAHDDECFFRPSIQEGWYLQAQQSFKPDTHAKYLNWVKNQTSRFFVNHAHIIIDPSSVGPYASSIEAIFKDSYDAQISNKLENSISVDAGNFYFKDPWFIDNYDDPKGSRNRGDDPIPHLMNFSTVPNLTTNSEHKGVFLDQGWPGWNSPYYSVKADATQDITLTQTGRTHKFYFQKWSGSGANIENENALQTGVAFNSYQDAAVYAILKGTQLSGNVNAYSTNSQRKFIRTVDGSLHSVYESMGYVWYEKSTNSGSTWQLMNGGKPIGNREAKSPSLCYINNTLFIAYQYDSYIGITWFNSSGQYASVVDSIINPLEEIISYETDASPVIEAKSDRLMMVYKNGGLKYEFFLWYSDGLGDLEPIDSGDIMNTDNSSVNPTIAVDKSSSSYSFHIAWGQGDNIIRYQKVTSTDGIKLDQESSCYKPNLAANDGYTKNYVPSLVVLGDDLARASWIGERITMAEGESIVDKRTVFRGVRCDGISFSFWNFGFNVRSATIQKSNDNANYLITWNEEISRPPSTYNTTKATNNTTLSVIKNLNTTGHYVQVCNGDTKYDMYGMVFNRSALPYLFSKTNNIQSYFDNPSKEQNGSAVYAGREGTASKGESNIYYTVGDVMVDGSIINFKKITETTDINSNEDVKRYLETEPFGLNDNSSFLYSVQYGLTENSGSQFNNDEYINFKVKLVDAETNAVISVFDDINYSANNILPYNSLQYSVNTVGIGNRTVKLLLDINDNFGAVYSVTSKFADAEILPKAVRQEIGLGENINVTEYDLSQNYPNPFNPSTTIRYAIPKDGMVTLKIYDILGREVKTLVNNFKTKGRYEVNFDASNLSSGLYIYEIKSGDYKASKKMTLIK